MALARIKNRLSSTSSPAPPPSPMLTTARGNRSDPAFSTYLEKMKHMPDLNLPEYVNRSVIADVEYRLIKMKDKNSISEMIRSATKYGIFRISGHGISTEELQQAFTEAEFCFGLLADRWSRDGDREEFQWSRSAIVIAERRRDVAREERFRKFSQKMENVASKLEAIADDAARIIGSYGRSKSRKKIKETETRMTLFKHNNSALQPHTPRSSQTPRVAKDGKTEPCSFALSLHIPTEQGDFCLLSDEGPMSFRTSPDTIIITLGDQLEEWSCGEFRGAFGEINIEPEIQAEQGAYSVELKCSPSCLNRSVERINTISITEQIFVLLALLLLYAVLSYLLS
ncbi:2-oxoglutarate (2OG) and Fe(II)-dependent oxygenase superfamily protein [Artemisia annua]|uniref:2-oxoglutarate (2OG) and Fe(II)-dependent oxygenase superfamily protein n=1 Tax=Artemisia annua TaxID=35608 RepID=A0A2U1KWD8_ARTAN|nr:2-oxoglutarate (2OG) and Fe(II)-dependent oxygenase superfamily protein [Artemisia annua]